ncbi:MAG: efflux RND transporter periplasmic adaptor subunit [Campylobacterota bacterium]|nr:efflux RND transporter periplasmic adaptor subunit [Campylobacterota bacterium]
MNKKLLLLTLFTFYALHAENIQMTAEQKENWQIKVEAPENSKRLPLGEFITEVVTPPSLLHIISLPFEANVKKLNVAKYQKVTKGFVLAEVTGTEWIAIQQKAIADAIEFRHHTHLTERKNMLCKEEIIPQKECVAANAELETDKIKVAASKALLQSYGASDEMITTLFKDLKLSQTMKIKSSVDGHIVELNAIPGKSTSPSDALFIIQGKGSLWLVSNIEARLTENLHEGQAVQITLANKTFNTTILQISPVINPQNQTKQIRFSVPSDINIFSGLRSSAKFTILGESLKVQKTSVIKEGGTQIVFIKTKEGFTAVPVKILAEDNRHYFIEPSDRLQNKIAVNSVAILKNMLGDSNE